MNAKLLLNMGFSGKRIGEILKWAKTATSEEIEEFKTTGKIPSVKIELIPGTVWWWLCFNPCLKDFRNASHSEKLRWLEEGAVMINGERAKPDDCFPEKLESLVFFPNGKHKTTMI